MGDKYRDEKLVIDTKKVKTKNTKEERTKKKLKKAF